MRDDARAGTSRLQRRLRDGLVAAEIALALVLLVGAGLLVASLVALQSQDLGFKPERVLTVEVSLSPPRFANLEQIRAGERDLVERFKAIAGVEAASGVLLRPLWSSVGYDNMHVLEGQRPDEAAKNPVSNFESAMPGYFATMGIPLVAGRDFTYQDDAKSPGVVIVSRQLRPMAWPGQDPLGKRLKVSYSDKWLTVIGVVADTRYREIETSRLDVFQPHAQFEAPIRHFVIRAAGDRLIPSAELVRFTMSGTEATHLALRLARAYTGRPKIVKFTGHFHGWHDGVSAGVNPPFDVPMSAGIPGAVLGEVLLAPPTTSRRSKQLLGSRSDIGAVILEPSGGQAGVYPSTPDT